MTSLGHPRFAEINHRVEAVFHRHRPVIVAHRGTSAGSVPENTASAAHAAFLSGADIVEIDVIASRDGEFFVFHTGTEDENLGVQTRLEHLSAEEIGGLRYRALGRGGRPQEIERLDALLDRFRGTERLFNIDRSWHLWPPLLDALDRMGIADQLLLKCPAREAGAIAELAAHRTPFPFMLICRSLADIEAGLAAPGLNLIGVELIADGEHSALADRRTIQELQARGLFVLANAEVLGGEDDLFAGYDDDVSVAVHPDLGWGRLFDLGVHAIQTDWPWLLREYRDARSEGALVELERSAARG